MYHNTLELPEQEVMIFERRINNQEKEILHFFEAHRGEMFTPFEVLEYFPMYPITSIRRTMTDLTKIGKLVKTGVLRTGFYGDPNHCWMVR